MLSEPKKKVKTIAVYLPVYLKVLKKKNEYESEEGRVLSFNEVIDKKFSE